MVVGFSALGTANRGSRNVRPAPLNGQEASLLFRMVSYRYQRGSTLITTNKAVKDRPEILAGDEAMATALLDRLLHHCHVLCPRHRDHRMSAAFRPASPVPYAGPALTLELHLPAGERPACRPEDLGDIPGGGGRGRPARSTDILTDLYLTTLAIGVNVRVRTY